MYINEDALCDCKWRDCLDGPHLRIGIWHQSPRTRYVPQIAHVEVRKRANGPEASWQRMMVTDPAVPTFIDDNVHFKNDRRKCQVPLSMRPFMVELREELESLDWQYAEPTESYDE